MSRLRMNKENEKRAFDAVFGRIPGYTAAGAIFGGFVLLSLATLLAVVVSWYPGRQFAKDIVEAAVPLDELALGVLLIIALGMVGLLCEYFRFRPSHEQVDAGLIDARGLDSAPATAHSASTLNRS